MDSSLTPTNTRTVATAGAVPRSLVGGAGVITVATGSTVAKSWR